ncbi:MAG: formate dehydrogenase associated protein [Symbiobacteriaceae bacterium]|nr:formate dehydrogenase associated protein [Symbiobacteriaceae bacterium]
MTVYLNDREWVTVQATPADLGDWALGYLCGEGVIGRPDDLTRLVVEEDRGLIWADVPSWAGPQPREPIFQPVAPGPAVAAEQLLAWMAHMLENAPLYQETGGMHVAAAVRLETDEWIIREDIGRHNAVDKVLGRARLSGWPPEQVAVLTSGRISYEMCSRLARFGAGIGVSRTAATDQAYRLAMELGIDLVGYVRTPASLVIYTPGLRVLRRVRHAG